jgi:2-C-methyl-D-erythritol 4-phosphate cytidylyltransferase
LNAAIIAAGGSGDRFGDGGGKQLALVAGLPVLAHALLAFERCDAVDAVVVVTHPDRVEEYRREAVEAIGATKVVAVVAGGSTRRSSVAAGIAALPAGASLVAVHDGARAAVTAETIGLAFQALSDRPDVDGVVVGHPSFDTVKRVDADSRIIETPDRAELWIAQTPQVFRARALARAHARAAADGFDGTDDASLVERIGGTVLMVQGPRWNMKVTVPEDIEVLAALLAARARTEDL